MQETHLENGNTSQHLCESETVSMASKENMKPQNSEHDKEEEKESNTTSTHSGYVDKEQAILENQTELCNIEQRMNNSDTLQNVMEEVESEHQVEKEEMYDFDKLMLNNETEIVDELEVYHAQMEQSMHLSSPLRHLMKEHHFDVMDYSDKTPTSVTASSEASSESQLSHSSTPTSESYSYTSSSITSASSSETEMSTNTTSTLIYETHAKSPSTMLLSENEIAAHHHKHSLQISSEDNTTSFTLGANNNNNNNNKFNSNTAYALLPELMNDMDGELLEIIRSYYARKQKQQQEQEQESQKYNVTNNSNEKLSLEEQKIKPNKYHHSHHENQDQHNAKGKMQVEATADKIPIYKNSLDRRESNTVELSLPQAPNNISRENANCTEQVKLPEPPTLNVMDGNYIGDDDSDSDGKLITKLQKANHSHNAHSTSTTDMNNKGRFESNGVLRNRHRHNTNIHNNNKTTTTQNTNRSNRHNNHATQQIAHNYHRQHQHHLSLQSNNNNTLYNNNNHNYYHNYRQRDQPEQQQEEELLSLSSSEEEGELLHQHRRSSVQRRSFADDFRLPEYSSTSFVRAYFADIHLNAEPAVLVSGLAAALNMAIVLFLQHHVLDTHDHLGLFLIGSYLVFATYYMTYYFLERFSSSFRTITSLDKKFYVISNLLKAGIFVSITPFAFYHLIQMIVFDKWENNILRNLGCIYTVPDFIAIIIVKRMRWSTWIHHWCVVAFNYFSIMNDYRNENVCRCVVVYAAFSSFAYCVNVLLASRFLGLPTLTSHILAYVALTVYALCCAVNWVWQAYYLHRLMTTGHRHWTVYAYIVLISLVMWDDVVLTKWLYNNAQSSAFVMAARQEQQKQQQQEQRQEEQQHLREELQE